MKKAAAIALCLAALASPAAAADLSWTISEGSAATQLRGVWHLKFQGDRVAGHAEMATPTGRKVTYQINGQRQNGEIQLQRGNPSDGQACAYRGKVAANGGATGAVLCGKTASAWTAVKR
jgi:hypothetical protein